MKMSTVPKDVYVHHYNNNKNKLNIFKDNNKENDKDCSIIFNTTRSRSLSDDTKASCRRNSFADYEYKCKIMENEKKKLDINESSLSVKEQCIHPAKPNDEDIDKSQNINKSSKDIHLNHLNQINNTINKSVTNMISPNSLNDSSSTSTMTVNDDLTKLNDSKKIKKRKKRRFSWNMIETDEKGLLLYQSYLQKATNSFVKSSQTNQKQKAISFFKQNELFIEKIILHDEKTQMTCNDCENELKSLHSYLEKIQEYIKYDNTNNIHLDTNNNNSNNSRILKNDELRKVQRMEWSVKRMEISLQSVFDEMTENNKKKDLLLEECTNLFIQLMTLIHIRGHTADYTGKGVAAGAASVVAGTLVTVAGVLAAPATGGFSLPISIAGKGLLAAGVATLMPSSSILKRQNKQLHLLTKLGICIKNRLEIIKQKKQVITGSTDACRSALLNLQQTGRCFSDAATLEDFSYEDVAPFILTLEESLKKLENFINIYNTFPNVFHSCYPEDMEKRLLLLVQTEE